MRERPILFNTEMVRAILDGRKTCTRRLVKFLPGKNPQWTGYIKDGLMLYNGKNELCIRKAPYQPGDILYVRETWCSAYGGEKYFYLADKLTNREERSLLNYDDVKWHPSIYMPKEAARIWLKVTDVRVERLQEIDIEGMRNEGLSSAAVHAGDTEIALKEWKILWNYNIKKSELDTYGWSANPWVWVIEFVESKKTNADKIKNMSDEELARFLTTFNNKFGEEYEGEISCIEWLQSEAE